MNSASPFTPEVVHSIPGRLRLKCAHLDEGEFRYLEARLRLRPGVRSVRAEPVTGSVTVHFLPSETDEQEIVSAAAESTLYLHSEPPPPATALRDPDAISVIHETVARRGKGSVRRVRVGVRGLDRDTRVARHVVERLTRRPGVVARANPLTGRVLIEFDERIASLRELLTDIADVELPGLPGEDNPSHPLDPVPLTQSAVRTGGAALGLGLLAARKLLGAEEAVISGPALSYVGGLISLAEGAPWVRNGVRKIFGRNYGDLALSLPDIAVASLVSSPLALASNGTAAVQLLQAVVARRQSWKRYEEKLGNAADAVPGSVVRLEPGDITPLPAAVVEGRGTASTFDGTLQPFEPGDMLPAGAKLRGSRACVLEFLDTEPFEPRPRSADPVPSIGDRYQEWNPPASLALAAFLGIATRSAARAMEALLFLSPRAALAGSDAANLQAAARATRGGATVVGTRPHRHIRLPDTLIVESARILTDGLEISDVEILEPGLDPGDILHLGAQVSAASGSPWGDAFGAARFGPQGEFGFGTARASIEGSEYFLKEHHKAGQGADCRALLLSREAKDGSRPLALFCLRPRIASGLVALVDSCQKNRVQLVMLATGESAVAEEVANRVNISVAHHRPGNYISLLQQQGQRVAYVSDGAQGGEPFSMCDLAIGLSSGRHGRFAARADVLVPDLSSLTAVIEAAAIGKKVARDAVGFSLIANVIGAAMCIAGPTGIVAASRAVHVATLAAYANAAFRFRGGERSHEHFDRYSDPLPEQTWGRRSVLEVCAELNTGYDGLAPDEACERLRSQALSSELENEGGHPFLKALWAQLCSPLIGLMAIGAAFTFAVGTPIEFGFVTLTIAANIFFGAWQEHQVTGASKALGQLAPVTAHVVRSGELRQIPANELVVGDVVLVSAGDRSPADARIIESEDLEADEASLTGESLPVRKSADSDSDAGRILLEGSDVTVGYARAVVVAVGRKTRMGSIALAVSQEDRSTSPLNTRLAKLLQQFLPLAAIAGAVVFGSGLIHGREWMPELVLAVTLALSAIPEGLPLLAGVAQVAVSKRLRKRRALLKRLGAVESLGRVDVACTDKTGTLTEGKPALSLVATKERVGLLESGEEVALSEQLRQVLIAAALASPHPNAYNARAHQTDTAVMEGATRAGLGLEASAERLDEAPFEPARAFHASRVGRRIVLKGAPEAVVARCSHLRLEAGDKPLGAEERSELLLDATQIASRGMRVLMVAEGPPDSTLENPGDLIALGFIGIRDPLRAGVREAMRRCREAGVKVIMLTGDHPATAKAISVDAGLITEIQEVLTGLEISALTNEELDRRLRSIQVVARVTPLDKVRIVESLQRMGHTVAMTGDGVNDAPALRRSDVGVAMGKGGTEVARQAADVVLADDNFATLVEAFVEGRGFWHNIRTTLGLLLGGILGEIGFVAITAATGLPTPLNTRQILAMNLITFGLPTLAVALQEPETHNLSRLAREGTSALEKPLRNDVLRRFVATAGPSLAVYLLALPLGGAEAQTAAFLTTICSQLAQTIGSGNAEIGLTRPVLAAVGTSLAMALSAIYVPQLGALLSLCAPSPAAWALIGAGTLSAPLLVRALASVRAHQTPPRALPALTF